MAFCLDSYTASFCVNQSFSDIHTALGHDNDIEIRDDDANDSDDVTLNVNSDAAIELAHTSARQAEHVPPNNLKIDSLEQEQVHQGDPNKVKLTWDDAYAELLQSLACLVDLSVAQGSQHRSECMVRWVLGV